MSPSKQRPRKTPTIWAVGGGKGGVGKSITSSLIAYWLAQMGKRTVLVDCDLGGANVHIVFGIKNPPLSLQDYFTNKQVSLDDICIDTKLSNLRLICGSSEILSLANPLFQQKTMLMRALYRLDCDHVIVDLGAGCSYNVLDFFLIAHKKIIVVTPQPLSIQNAYAFLRNVVFRKLSILFNKQPAFHSLINTAMNPKNPLRIQTVKELHKIISESGSPDMLQTVNREFNKIHPGIITNMVSSEKDRHAGSIIQVVSDKYLTIQTTILGSIQKDEKIETMINSMTSLLDIERPSTAISSAYEIVRKSLSS